MSHGRGFPAGQMAQNNTDREELMAAPELERLWQTLNTGRRRASTAALAGVAGSVVVLDFRQLARTGSVTRW